MKKYLIYIVFIFALNFNFIFTQEVSTHISLELNSNVNGISGKYLIDTVNWARIDNPKLPKKASIGMFTNPPNNSLPFDIAFVVGNMTGGDLDADKYNAVKVVNDEPLFALNTKSGFMTIVINNSSIPKDEFYSTDGFFLITTVTENLVDGEFEITLVSTKQIDQIKVKGSFKIKID